MNAHPHHAPNLLAKHRLSLAYAVSLLIAGLIFIVSVAGLLFWTDVYPTDELLESFVPTDVVNLFIGLPILLVSMGLAWRGRLIGLLLWPGALFFVLYTYLIYTLAMPLNLVALLQLALVIRRRTRSSAWSRASMRGRSSSDWPARSPRDWLVGYSAALVCCSLCAPSLCCCRL